jgi:hypothetical protein
MWKEVDCFWWPEQENLTKRLLPKFEHVSLVRKEPGRIFSVSHEKISTEDGNKVTAPRFGEIH